MAMSATFFHGANPSATARMGSRKAGFFAWAQAVIAEAHKREAEYRARQKEMAMAINATLPHAAQLAARTGNKAEKSGFFSRLLAFIIEAREREAERKIAQLAERHGNLMSDQLERDIDRFAL